MKKKQKGFTLIELLIVVAIIGILAAVGAAVIPGLLGGAKVKATTANHKEITNFMMIKFTQCSTGEADLTYTSNATGGTTTVACSTNAQGHLAALVNHLKFENFNNPHTPAEVAAYSSTGATPADGRTNISCSGDTCNVYTNTGDEVLSAVVKKE